MLIDSCRTYWLDSMINTQAPAEEEKGPLLHGVIRTGLHERIIPNRFWPDATMFPAMGWQIPLPQWSECRKTRPMNLWLDNKDSHKEAVNENYGRELLELFRWGVELHRERRPALFPLPSQDADPRCSCTPLVWHAILFWPREIEWQFEYPGR